MRIAGNAISTTISHRVVLIGLWLAAVSPTIGQSEGLANVSQRKPVRLPSVTTHEDSPVDPLQPVILSTRSFRIPFHVQSHASEQTDTSPTTLVRLYASQGANHPWVLSDSQPSSIREFVISCKEDGEWWFATETVSENAPAIVPATLTPQLKVLVDSQPPVARLIADSDADGTIRGEIVIEDLTPVVERRLFYATEADHQWIEEPLGESPSEARFEFSPKQDWREVSIHVCVTDSAGHQSIATGRIERPRLAAAASNLFAADRSTLTARPVQYRQPFTKPSVVTQQQNTDHPPLFVRPAPSDPDDQAINPVVKLDRVKPTLVSDTDSEVHLAPLPDDVTIRIATNPLEWMRGVYATATGNQRATAPIRIAPPATPPSFQSVSSTRATLSTGPVELPPAATAEQVANSFQLNSPQGSMGLTLPPTPAMPPTYTSPQASALPSMIESLPSSALPVANPSPQTAAEAMRPLDPQRPIRPAPPSTSTPPALSAPSTFSLPSPMNTPPASQVTSATPVDPYQANRPAPAAIDPAAFADRVPTRYSNSNRFSLEYELEAVGSRGVDAVELYGNNDGGNTWKFWGQDPDKVSPFDIETKEDGVFGFRIVVVGANGLASSRPMPNDTPDIVVVVDKSAPLVRIIGAQYGEGDRVGSLVIRYQCEDVNLPPRPITLSYSDRVDGPWTTIAAGLKNQSEHIWPADPNLPRKLFLRIDATDSAGNTGSYILDRPIDAQGLAPRARIRAFQPLSGDAPATDNEQTASGPQASFK